jgi:Uri superfamily endonuclease
MHPLPGTYALIFSAYQKSQLKIGKLGALQLKPGFYVYIGSAFGPGGLKARIAHHRKETGHPHWHIDYLGSFLNLIEIWYTNDPIHREHQWAQTLLRARGASVPLAGFGSSDCRCKAHLFFQNSRPSIKTFRRKIHTGINHHHRIFLQKFLDKFPLSDNH